jgi:CRP/FNR family transcriptional regulator, cyclic AMP receptor protein
MYRAVTMNAVFTTFTTDARADIQGLAQAIATSPASDALRCQFNPSQWEALAGYFQPFVLQGGQVVIEQGAQDRTLYFIESGGLSVHYEDDKGRVRMALVSAGSVVGEGAFFSHLPRSATVQTTGPSKLWCLTSDTKAYLDFGALQAARRGFFNGDVTARHQPARKGDFSRSSRPSQAAKSPGW